MKGRRKPRTSKWSNMGRARRESSEISKSPLPSAYGGISYVVIQEIRRKKTSGLIVNPQLATQLKKNELIHLRRTRVSNVMAKAKDVFGDEQYAENWMYSPALGLDGASPWQLAQSKQGYEMVMDFLGRLEYGVYQ